MASSFAKSIRSNNQILSYVSRKILTKQFSKKNGPKKLKIPEPPTTCCMSGCPNCVWIQYAEKLTRMFQDGGEQARKIIFDKVTDPNMRSFLDMELKNLKKKKRLKTMNADPEIVKRAQHAITEIKRTAEAADALKERNYLKFGQLMVESHTSLKNDFEVSCNELDVLVSAAIETEGVLGSRMTGGGFGGCTVTMVYDYAVDDAIRNMQKRCNGSATFYVCSPSDGAKILKDI